MEEVNSREPRQVSNQVVPCHCGARCVFDNADCYGEVSAVGETTYDPEEGPEWVHACENEKHRDEAPVEF